MNNNNPISLVQNNFTGTFTRGQEPMSYSQAVKQATAPENPLASAITVVESPNATDINDRTIANVWSINVEGNAIDFEFIDSASLPFTPAPDEVFYKCAFVNNEPTNPLISDLLFFTPHAINRMEERQISYAHVLYSLNATPIESYDNQLVLNSNLESISTVVELVESVGYIVTTVVRKESAALNLELLQLDIELEPIYGDEKCNNIEELEQFYQGILADANENPYRQGKAAYNLAILLHSRFNILNELYLDSWLDLIKQAIVLGHPQAKIRYVSTYINDFLTDLQEREKAYFLPLEEEIWNAGNTAPTEGGAYKSLKERLIAITAKNPLSVEQLTMLVWVIAGNKEPIPFDLLSKLFLIKRPEIILFLLTNWDNQEISILKAKINYLISKLFDLQSLKELFENLHNCVQEQVLQDTIATTIDIVMPGVKEDSLEFCQEILVDATIKYGAEILKISSMQKQKWEFEMQKDIRVAENFVLWMEFGINYINQEQGSALSILAQHLNNLAPHLQNYPGIVIYQASQLLNKLTEEAKGAQHLSAFRQAVYMIITRIGMANLISPKEAQGWEGSQTLKTALKIVHFLMTNEKRLGDSLDFYTLAIENSFKNYPTLRAFFFLTLAQILHSEGDIQAAQATLIKAQDYCVANAKIIYNKKHPSVPVYIWNDSDKNASPLLQLIVKFYNEYNQ